MSDDDVLDLALRALRESTDGAHAGASQTRTRVLLSAQRVKRRRPWVKIVVLPMAAAFLVSTAWAAVTGRLPALFERALGHGSHPISQGAPKLPPSGAENAAPVSPTPSAEPPPDDAIEIQAPRAAESPAAPAAASITATPLPRATPRSEGPSPGVSAREQSLYEAAHRAHFVEHDPAAALRAWDAYVLAYPKGRFAVEARYNRAISLVRLGRKGDARAALRPFANGAFAGYRQREAGQLLDALGTDP